MTKKNSLHKGRLLLALLLTCLCGLKSVGQTPPPSTVSPIVTRDGFSLQKATSLSNVKTGQVFTYTISFSIPAGSTNVTLSDLINPPLVIDNVIIPTGGYVGAGTPAVSTAGNTVSVFFASVPVSITGSFQINVHFPVTNSCHGLTVLNSASLSTHTFVIKTDNVSTSAIVNNPWKIKKKLTTPLLVNNTCQPLTTTYGTTTDTVKYTVDITKNSSAIIGSASLYNVSLKDLLPSGATVIPGSSPSTALTTTSNVPPCSIDSAGVVTFSTPFTLDASTNPVYTLSFYVVHNNLGASSCQVNRMALNGYYHCDTTDSTYYADTASVGIRLIPVDSSITTLSKTVTLGGNVPGCTGTYKIRVRNYGPGTLHEYVLLDTLPSCLIPGTVTAPAGCSITLINTSPVVYELRANPGTFLPPPSPAQYHDYTISFTIGNSCSGTVSNTVWADSGITGKATCNFPLLPPVVKPCITKQICGTTGAYAVGDTVRFRVRIQNLGAVPLLGFNVTDALDAANLEYIGNEAYYYTATLDNNQQCGVASNWQAHVTTTNTPGATNLSWHVDTIRVECGSVANTACGQGYNLPAYYIEFSVRIKDTAGIGNIQNIATIQGGNITTPVWDDVSFVVNGNLNYGINKAVSADGGTTFGPSATVAPGSTIQYQLGCTNLGIPLAMPLIADLLPRDNIGGVISDNFILAPFDRGSNINVGYDALVSTSHTIASAGQSYSSASGITTLPELGVTVNTNPAGWTSTPTTSTANFVTHFSQAIGTLPFTYVFSGIVDPNATAEDRACNTFAIRGSGKYMINYLPFLVPQPPVESNAACIATTKPDCCDPVDIQVPGEVCAGFSQQFCAIDTCGTNIYTWDFGDGTPFATGNCVSHTYASAGTYSIKVIWKNDCREESKKYEIVVKDCPCDIKASAEITANGNTITANAGSTTSSLPIVLYVWDFGDGSIGTGLVATHTYAAAGSYTVTLTAYSITPRGDVCECIDRCRTEIVVNPRILENIFRCGITRREAKANTTKATSIASDFTIKAVPNPFSSYVTVRITPAASNIKEANGNVLEFATSNGSTLQSISVKDIKAPFTFQTGGYPPGSYIIMLKNNTGKIQSIKVVKLQ